MKLCKCIHANRYCQTQIIHCCLYTNNEMFFQRYYSIGWHRFDDWMLCICAFGQRLTRIRALIMLIGFILWYFHSGYHGQGKSNSLLNNKCKVYCYLQFMWRQIYVPSFISSLSYYMKRKHQYHYNIADW